jgi:hypothetical protein
MRSLRPFLSIAALLAAAAVAWPGCGGQHGSGFATAGMGGDDDTGNPGGGSGGGGGYSDDAGLTLGGGNVADGASSISYVLTLDDGGVTKGAACPTGAYTSISGKIYDPAGNDPLYGAVAYVPSKPLAPLTSGASCDSCESLFSGSPVAAAQTDATGHFVIANAPSGTNIPLVVQLGKWRMTYTIPSVKSCVDNPQANGTLRLPHNHTVGNIPNIAISTGGADTLECLLSRMGVDASEYTGGAGGAGRIHIFAGGESGTFFGISIGTAPNTNPPGPASSAGLWDSAADIDPYDIVILSCEGNETYMANQQVLFDYAKVGGRVFASHFHYAWFNTGPFSTAADLATWTTGSNSIGTQPNDSVNGIVETSLASGAAFPKGVAMKAWLGNVGALGVNGAPAGEIPIVSARHNANVTSVNTPSTSWIIPDPSAAQSPGSTLYFSFNTPLGTAAEAPCGRIVYSDLHVGGGSMDTGGTVPGECASGELSPQEKALEFMLYDLSACVVPDNAPPPVLNIVQ